MSEFRRCPTCGRIEEVASGELVTPGDTPVEKLRLELRLRKTLIGHGIKTVGDLRKSTDAQLYSLRGVSLKSVFKLRRLLGRERRL